MKKAVACVGPMPKTSCYECGTVVSSRIELQSHMSSCPYRQGFFRKSICNYNVPPQGTQHPGLGVEAEEWEALEKEVFKPGLLSHLTDGGYEPYAGCGWAPPTSVFGIPPPANMFVEMKPSAMHKDAFAEPGPFVERARGGGKSFWCVVCNKFLATSASLTRHMRVIHGPPPDKDSAKGTAKDSSKGTAKGSAKGTAKDSSKGSAKGTAKDRAKGRAKGSAARTYGRLPAFATLPACHFPPTSLGDHVQSLALASPVVDSTAAPHRPAPANPPHLQTGWPDALLYKDADTRLMAAFAAGGTAAMEAMKVAAAARSQSAEAMKPKKNAAPPAHGRVSASQLDVKPKKEMTTVLQTSHSPRGSSAMRKQPATYMPAFSAAAAFILANSAASTADAAARMAVASGQVAAAGQVMLGCANCAASFANMMDLKQHIRLAHSARVRCGQCGNQYASTDTLRRHVLAHHGRV